MAVDLVLRIHEVDVAGGAHRLIEGLAQCQNGAVELPQLLLTLYDPLTEHVHIVADRLDLQIIVPRGDTHQLVPALAVHDGPEQLARLTGGADNKSLPVFVDETLGHDGKTLEVLQMSQRDEFVEIAQTGLVLCQHDKVVGAAPLSAAAACTGAQGTHGGVDLLERFDAHIVQIAVEGHQHISHCGRIIRCPMVVEGRQIQILRHHVKLIFAQLGQEILAEDQGIQAGITERTPHAAAPLRDKAHIKLRVMGRQRAVAHPVEEQIQPLLLTRRVGHHFIGNTGQLYDLPRDGLAGIQEGVVFVDDLTVFQHHSADLGNALPAAVKAGGLDIKAHHLFFQWLLHGSVDDHPVIHVIAIIGLRPQNDFDLAAVSAGLISLRERLRDAVISDGNGRMAPGDGSLDSSGHIGQAVHGRVAGMQMQFHSFLLRQILTGRFWGTLSHGKGTQFQLAGKLADLKFALDQQIFPLFDLLQKRFCLLILIKTGHGD